MTFAASDQTAINLIAVQGGQALWVAGECVRTLLRIADEEAAASWLEVLDAVRTRLR